MPDWTKSMEQQTYEYYKVDPNTWRDGEKIKTMISSTIENDSEAQTLGSASFESSEALGECYIRTYLVTRQNGLTERFPLGTRLIQSQEESYNGMYQTIPMDAYTPLIELKENPPPLGYSIPKGSNIMDMAYRLIRENARAPVVEASSSEVLYSDFVSNVDDTWLTFLSDLIANANYEFGLDELGQIIFLPKQDVSALQPIKTFNDDNSSILLPDITLSKDLYNIPNKVEVVCSGASSGKTYYATAINDDPDSIVSTVNRGRIITHRASNIDFPGEPNEGMLQAYAQNLLKELSSVEYTVTFSHGYYPIRIGDCVRLNYTKANIVDVKAKIIKQSIECKTGCTITETAVYTSNLWG